MSLRWVDEDEPVKALPSRRRQFYERIEEQIREYDPDALRRIESELVTWLDDVSTGASDYASVKRNAGADWTGFERQTIYDVTENWDHSRWWCGLLLMKLAINHPDPFVGYRPGDPGSEVSTAYFLDRRALKS